MATSLLQIRRAAYHAGAADPEAMEDVTRKMLKQADELQDSIGMRMIDSLRSSNGYGSEKT
jgi:hypothetical protein